MKNYQASVEIPFGHLGLCFAENRLVAIDFIDAVTEIRPRDQSVAEVCTLIRRYLDNAKTVPSFNLPCALHGTPFQQKVWNELKKIPSGTVFTYGELANKLGTSARAIGNACRKNPIPLVIPCHRVVAANGIGGYAGDTHGARLRMKSWLLRHEGVTIS
jgi:methylated-DNA-[protein]-cysteine S-methyltransferase